MFRWISAWHCWREFLIRARYGKARRWLKPPFMLALSAWLAIKDAISAVSDYQLEPEFSLPATNEVILLSIEKMKARMKEKQAAALA